MEVDAAVNDDQQSKARAAVRVAEAIRALRYHDVTCRESVFILRGRCDIHDRDDLAAELDAALDVWLAERRSGVALHPDSRRKEPAGEPESFTRRDLAVLIDALDSHAYWQLSEPEFRDSGYVRPPGSRDAAVAEAIRECNAIDKRLHALLVAAPHAPECDMGEDCSCMGAPPLGTYPEEPF